MIITTLSASTLLPVLRDVLKTQILPTQHSPADVNTQLKACLERVALSRVFDINGLWEVLGELDLPTQMPDPSLSPEIQRHEKLQSESEIDEETLPSIGETEILDSQDEGGLSSPESTRETLAKPAAPERKASVPPKQPNLIPDEARKNVPPIPDIILITHMSSLLATLFTHREKASAHTTLQLMASHMRYLTRSPEHGGPLFLILNSTTSSAAPNDSTAAAANAEGPPRSSPEPSLRPTSRPNPPKPLDPTLRSIFNPPPQSYGYDAPPTRRNKPSFGLVFTQLLDMHLLCTRVPKRRADAEVLYAPPSSDASLTHGEGDAGPSAKQVEYATVVEVLLDEVGAWEVGGRGRRRSREQRWGAVEVWRMEGGKVRVVDAFDTSVKTPVGEIRLAAGFGGRVDR